MSGGGSTSVEYGQAWNPHYQKPVGKILGKMIADALRGPLPYQPSAGELPDVYNPEITEEIFQKGFVTPAITALTGRYGTIPRIGAAASSRGTYFSGGRQIQEADASLATMQNLIQVYAGLKGEDIGAAQSEWMAQQPLTSPLTQSALNYLGTPMMIQYQQGPNPWAQIGMGLGSAAVSGLMLSDARLKKNIFYVESNRFPRACVWEWNEIANALGLYGFGCGYIAQDIEKVLPDSVITLPSGYKGILYRI